MTNECSCNTGQPKMDFNVVDNLDGTYNLDLSMLDGLGNPEISALSTLILRDYKNDIIFANEYNYGDDSKNPTSTSVSNGNLLWNNVYAQFITGNIEDSSTVVFDYLGFAQLFGCNGDITFEFYFSHPRCGRCMPSSIRNDIDFEPPISNTLNINYIGGVSGVQTFELSLKESDNLTPLAIGDTVKFPISDNLTGVELEVVEGIYGNDISTFSQITGSVSSSITNWATGVVSDGSIINVAKTDYTDANNFNYQNGYFDGTNWISAAKQIKITVEAYDVSQCSWNENIDSGVVLERTVDLIEGSVFIQNSSLNPTSIYSMYDVGAENYNNQSSIEIRENGIVTSSVLPPFTPVAFSWGTRDIYTFNGSDNVEYQVDLGFDNSMQAFTNMHTNNTLGASQGYDSSISYNRRFSVQIADTFPIVLESAIASTLIQRATFNGDFYTAGSPNGVNSIFLNNNLVNTVNYVSFAAGGSAGETDWFNLDMGQIGKRNTIRVEVQESGLSLFNEYQLELNYIN